MQKNIVIGFVLTLIIAIIIPVYWAAEPVRQASAHDRQKAEAMERGDELSTLQEEGSFRVEVSLDGFNSTPGEFRLDVKEGQEVEITFVYGDSDLPFDNPHIIDIHDLDLSTFTLDRENLEVTVSFTAPKVEEVALFSLMCEKTDCAGHDNLLTGIIVVQPS